MCQADTRRAKSRLLIGILAFSGAVLAQAPSGIDNADWRRIGGTSVDLMLASPAGGPVDNVWFSSDGRTLYARTRTGRVFETIDFENWTAATRPLRPDNNPSVSVERLPAPHVVVRASPVDASRVYGLGAHLYQSEDGGRTWTNLTSYKGQSVIGPGQRDVAISPSDSSHIVVANERGVWRSLDGGLSWSGLNQFLPNLTVRRILAAPVNGRGVVAEIEAVGAAELSPALSSAVRRYVWQPVRDARMDREASARGAYSAALGAKITAVATAGDVAYAGSADGRIWVSADRGRSWTLSRTSGSGPVERLFADSQAPRVALAAVGGSGPRVLRTTNMGAGGFWDDLTSNLPDAAVRDITADRATGAVYVATDRGVYFAREDMESAGPAANWMQIGGNLPVARATAVQLDSAGNQLYVALEGYGVYAASAPHRAGALRVVNAADLSTRAAAPGSLLSVLGGPVRSARAGDLDFPILASSASGSQIQVPFEVTGKSVALALEAAAGRVSVGLAVEPTSPAIFVDRDGAPMLVDADSGLMLDAGNTARSNSRIHVLATGLGRVTPNWPTGIPAPLENPPAVKAAVRAYLDRAPVEVTRAILAPGYVGFYVIELQLPALVNAGPAELYVTADGQESNRVRVFLEP
jgi:uncharacterized protein (TIGR03437 family)